MSGWVYVLVSTALLLTGVQWARFRRLARIVDAQSGASSEVECWLVTADDVCYGVYATQELAEEHVARMPRPEEYEVEDAIVRTALPVWVPDREVTS